MLIDTTHILRLLDIIERSDVRSSEYQKLLLSILSVSDVIHIDPQLINKFKQILTAKITDFAMQKSSYYRTHGTNKTVKKEDLDATWFTNVGNFQFNQTNGTTANHFQYRVWQPAIRILEKDWHYRLILEEFGINTTRTKIVLIDTSRTNAELEGLNGRKITEMFVLPYSGHSRLAHHGSSDPTIDHIGFPIDGDIDKSLPALFAYLDEQQIDVMQAKGSFVSLMIPWLRTHVPPKNRTLLSLTYEGTAPANLEFLRKNGSFLSVCDHMKACDGGMAFFTCKHGTYHLLENHANVVAKNNQFICTDYYSITAPFINYHNDDTGTLANDFELCQCGRYFRSLSFVGRESFIVSDINGKPVTSIAIDDRISTLPGLIQVLYADGMLHIRSDRAISDPQSLFHNFKVTNEIGNFKIVGASKKTPRFVPWPQQ